MVGDGLCGRRERERHPGGMRSHAVRGGSTRMHRVDGARLGISAQQQEVAQGEKREGSIILLPFLLYTSWPDAIAAVAVEEMLA